MARAPQVDVDLLHPTAEPIDTFVRPQAPSQDNNLGDLAKSLSAIEPSLAALERQQVTQDKEDGTEQGTADYYKNGVGHAEAQDKGLIPAQANKYYVAAYKKTEGSVAGYTVTQDLNAAYDKWDKSGGDGGFDSFVKGFIKDRIQTTDPDTLKGLLPQIQQAVSSLHSRNINDQHTALVAASDAATSAYQNQAIDEAIQVGLARGQAPDLQGTFDKLIAKRNYQVGVGSNAPQQDKNLVDLITTAAIQRGGTDYDTGQAMMKFFDQKVPGQTYTYGETEYGRNQKLQTLDKLNSLQARAITKQDEARKAADKAALDDVRGRTIDSVFANPNADIPETLIQQGMKYDPEFRVHSQQWRDVAAGAGSKSDPQGMLDLSVALTQGGGIGAISSAVSNGVIKNADDYKKMRDLASSVDKAGPDVDRIMDGTIAKSITGAIQKGTLSSADMSAPFAVDTMSNAGFAANFDFRQQVLQWKAQNPNSTRADEDKAVSAIGSSILQSLKPRDGGVGGNTYERNPQTASRVGPNAFIGPDGQPIPQPDDNTGPAPAAAPPAAPARAPKAGAAQPLNLPPGMPQPPGAGAPAPAAAAAPQVPKPTFKEVSDFYNGLKPEQQAQIETKAQQTGKSVQDIVSAGLTSQRQAAAAQAAPKPPTFKEVSDAYSKLTPQQQDQVEAQAAQTGKSVQDIVSQGLVAQRGGAPAPTTPEQTIRSAFKAAFTRDEDAPAPPDDLSAIRAAFKTAFGSSAPTQGNYQVAALKDNPKAARILDFVAGPESKGNYNAVYGNGGSKEDLSKFTMAEMEQRMKAQGRATGSSATGRYQFMHDTLFGKDGKAGLYQRMGLRPADKFTPELQDKLALQLLKDRGYDRWVAGRMKDEDFANNLAMEWASLPNFRTGRSHYDGDGMNKSLVGVGAVKQTLNAAKGLPGEPPPTTIASR